MCQNEEQVAMGVKDAMQQADKTHDYNSFVFWKLDFLMHAATAAPQNQFSLEFEIRCG